MQLPPGFQQEMNAVNELSNLLLRYVIPLFKKVPGKRPSLFGSGFLVSSAKSTYLVSAAHVLDDYSQLYYYIKPTVTSKLVGTLIRTKLPRSRSRDDDRVDVGVLRLEGDYLPPYVDVEKYALPVSALVPNTYPRDGKQYLLVGFPATRSKANPAAQELKSTPISYRNGSVPASRYLELGISAQTHIAISLDLENVLLPTGSVENFPKPEGLSGSPIWLLYDEQGLNDRHQTPVIGVVIEHHVRENILVATDIDVALKLIAVADSQ